MLQWHEMSEAQRRDYAISCLEKRARNRLKYPLSVMAAAVGVSGDDLRRAADPNYQPTPRPKRETPADAAALLEASREEYEARRREIPADTRSRSATIFGDPIPGDSRRERYGNDYEARGGRTSWIVAGDSGGVWDRSHGGSGMLV